MHGIAPRSANELLKQLGRLGLSTQLGQYGCETVQRFVVRGCQLVRSTKRRFRSWEVVQLFVIDRRELREGPYRLLVATLEPRDSDEGLRSGLPILAPSVRIDELAERGVVVRIELEALVERFDDSIDVSALTA